MDERGSSYSPGNVSPGAFHNSVAIRNNEIAISESPIKSPVTMAASGAPGNQTIRRSDGFRRLCTAIVVALQRRAMSGKRSLQRGVCKIDQCAGPCGSYDRRRMDKQRLSLVLLSLFMAKRMVLSRLPTSGCTGWCAGQFQPNDTCCLDAGSAVELLVQPVPCSVMLRE